MSLEHLVSRMLIVVLSIISGSDLAKPLMLRIIPRYRLFGGEQNTGRKNTILITEKAAVKK